MVVPVRHRVTGVPGRIGRDALGRVPGERAHLHEFGVARQSFVEPGVTTLIVAHERVEPLMRELVHDRAVGGPGRVHDVRRELDTALEARQHRRRVGRPRIGPEARLVVRERVRDQPHVACRVVGHALVDAEGDVHAIDVRLGQREVSDRIGDVAHRARVPVIAVALAAPEHVVARRLQRDVVVCCRRSRRLGVGARRWICCPTHAGFPREQRQERPEAHRVPVVGDAVGRRSGHHKRIRHGDGDRLPGVQLVRQHRVHSRVVGAADGQHSAVVTGDIADVFVHAALRLERRVGPEPEDDLARVEIGRERDRHGTRDGRRCDVDGG